MLCYICTTKEKIYDVWMWPCLTIITLDCVLQAPIQVPGLHDTSYLLETANRTTGTQLPTQLEVHSLALSQNYISNRTVSEMEMKHSCNLPQNQSFCLVPLLWTSSGCTSNYSTDWLDTWDDAKNKNTRRWPGPTPWTSHWHFYIASRVPACHGPGLRIY